MRPALARREEAAGSAAARTTNEASAGRAIRVRRELTQKVRLNKGEKAIRNKAISEELSGQSRIQDHWSRQTPPIPLKALS